MMALPFASPIVMALIALIILCFGIHKVARYMVKSLDRDIDRYLKSKGLLIIAGLSLMFASCSKYDFSEPVKEKPPVYPDRPIKPDTLTNLVTK